MKLTKLVEKTRKIKVLFLGETAEVEYRMAAVTPKFMDEIKDLNTIDSIIHQVAMTVVNWDLTDEQDMVIPPTVEGIRKFNVPISFLSHVLTRITEDMSGWSEDEKKA